MSKPVFMVSVCSSVKIKGRDCGTINGHDRVRLEKGNYPTRGRLRKRKIKHAKPVAAAVAA
ncbi:hypothetical protein DVQ29_18475 [Yersinia enterocolitica]|nr:hypothetical protein [Yersinia enterocolitica]